MRRVVTIAFGALPMLIWLPLVTIWVLGFGATALESAGSGEVIGILIGLLFVAWGVLGLWGAYSLWAAALGPSPVSPFTVRGLVAGIAAMSLIFGLLVTDSPGDFVDPAVSWLIVAPLAVAAWHIRLYLRES